MKADRRPVCSCGRPLNRHDIGVDARGRRVCYYCHKVTLFTPERDMPPVPVDRDGNRVRYPAGMDPAEYPAYLAATVRQPKRRGTRQTQGALSL